MEEIEQHNKELCKENQELKDSCVSLQKQNSDLQAELHKKEVWLLVKQEPENKPTNKNHEPGVQRSGLNSVSYQAPPSVLLVILLPYINAFEQA